jgi:transcription elongation factor Elf1
MPNPTDYKFVMMLTSRLPLAKVKSTSPHKLNFRCVMCGDSNKSKFKTRGWLLEKEGNYMYYCHNCGYSNSLGGFLKTYDPSLYNDYISEKYVSKMKDDGKSFERATEDFQKKKVKFQKNPLSSLKKISQLAANHPAKLYIESRKIPTKQHYRIFYATKFRTWINSIIPGKLDVPENIKDEPRLIFPLNSKSGELVGVSARGFDPKGLRYITIMFNENASKMFGLDLVDMDRTYFVVEGAIDSLFLPNAIAMVGADSVYDSLNNKENAIFVFDAEPRNREITNRMEKLISLGYRICIWPSNISGKDINDMVLSGNVDVVDVIMKNTFQGLAASLKLSNWRKT